MPTTPLTATRPVSRVVIVDDSPDDRAEVRRLLLRGSARRYAFVEAETGGEAVSAVLADPDGPPDCLVLDYYLPDAEADDVLANLAGPDGLLVCPVVVLTAKAGREAGRKALRRGAHDFLGKDGMTPDSMTRAVENAVERFEMARELTGCTAALRKSEARLRLALEASATGLWVWDTRTGEVTWSPECYRLHGVSEGEFDGTGDGFFRLVHPDDRAHVKATVRAAIAERRLYECEFRIVRPNGEVLWVANRARASYDTDGRPLQVLGTITDISARKRAEHELQASVRRERERAEELEAVMRSVPAAIWIASDPGCRSITGNPESYRLLRMGEGENVSATAPGDTPARRPYREFRDGAPVPPDELPMQVAARTGADVTGTELTFVFADGTVRHAFGTASPLRDPDGNVRGAIAAFIDITAWKETAEALRARERQLQTVADNSPDVLARFDRELRHLFVSAAAERITGRPCAEFLGKTNRELGMPEHLCDQWEDAIRSTFASGRPKTIEFTFDAPDGPRHFTARVVAERGATGAIESVLTVTSDVTGERVALESVQLSEERLRLAAEAAGFGAYDVNLLTGQTYWSPQMRAILGVAPNLDAARYVATAPPFVHPADRERVEALTKAFHEPTAPESVTDEHRVIRPSGEVRWVFLKGRTYFVGTAPDRRPVRHSGVIVDITDRKLAEEALKEADRQKSEFLATLAHELRNPLAPIRNGLELIRLAGGTASPRVQDMIERQLGHMVRLVDDLLDISRISSGKVELQTRRVRIQTVIEHALDASRSYVESAGHELTVRTPDEPVWVDGDLTRLAQVVSNLVNNAAKYTPNGGRIALEAGAAGGAAIVCVTDNGTGIAAEMLPKVFDLFAQVNETLDRAQGGLGIGLALVRKLVELHRGSIEAESPGLGRGSTFTVRLPLAPGPGAKEPPTAPARGAASVATRRVLVVDDNVDGAESLAELLRLQGHETRTAHTGPEAIAAARAFAPEIVFLDIGLPGLSGYEVARRLRGEPGPVRPVLVALTGWGTDADKRQAKEAGFDAHLTKPVESDRVTALLTKFRDYGT